MAIASQQFIKNTVAFYCPVEVDPRWVFNSEVNPFPVQLNICTRAGYGTRPVVDWRTGERPQNAAGVLFPFQKLTKLRGL